MPIPTWPKFFGQQVALHKNPRRAVNAVRAELGDRDPRAVFEDLGKNAMFRHSVAVSPEPRTFARLGNFPRLVPRGLLADVQWAAEVICLHSKTISGFLELEKQFDHDYLLGRWNHCLYHLDELEKRHGLSLWMISRRITVLRRVSLASDEDYAAKLIASTTNGTIMSWLVYVMSFRADPNVTAATYVRTVEASLGKVNSREDYVSFFRYYALSAPPRTASDAAGIVAIAEILPIIDLYTALLDLYQFAAVHCEVGTKEWTVLSGSVRRVAEVVADDRLTLLVEVNSPEKAMGLIGRVHPVEADLYTAGDYDSAVRCISTLLRESPEKTSLYSLLARASLRSSVLPDLPEPISDIVRTMAAIQIFSEEDARGVDLSREALTGVHRSLCASIRCLFKGLGDDPSQASADAAIEALNEGTLTPFQLRNLPVSDGQDLLAKAQEAFPESIAIALQSAVLGFGSSYLAPSIRDRLPTDRADLYSARAFLRLCRLTEAIELLEQLETSSVTLVANDARRELYRALMAAKEYRKALRLVARAYQHNERLHSIFRLDPLLEAVEQFAGGLPFDEISLSICYHVINRFGGDRRLGAQADAAEEFVLSRHVNLPSQLDVGALELERDLLLIYLDQVCSPATLDRFMALETVDQVEVERLDVCRILSEIDSANRQRYLDEIREITRRRIVRDRFEQVERTKIYVDTEGVKRQAEKTLRDTYNRFAATSAEEMHASRRLEIVKKVQQILADVKTDGVKIFFPDLPASEGEQMFDRLIEDVMHLLVSSQEYGLEAYLSTRVRHGTMGNQLRSAFEVHSLLTQRDNGRYQPDSHWSQLLGLNSHLEGSWLADRLAVFSGDLDSLIEDLVRKRVQVRSEATPDGLFVFQSFNYDVVRLQGEITPDIGFDTFMDKVIDQFWMVLEHTLGKVRQYIETDFLNAVHASTDLLEKDVVNELTPTNISPLRDAIAAARTQISVNVANVANWFTLARDMERPDYEFDVAVAVATESIRVCHPSLSLSLRRSDEISFECRGKTLESLVYMLFTALDNAVEHCGFTDHGPTILLETSLQDSWLELRLVNSCEPIKYVDEENRNLIDLRDRLERGNEAQGLATMEGGSGYAKIIRILRHDLLARYSLEFGYRSSTEYAVTIGMDAKAVVK